MDMTAALTVSKLTPPGYFNLAQDAPALSAAYFTWFNAILSSRAADSNALRTLVLTPWLTSFSDSPRAPWLQYLLSQYGLASFGGTNNQAAALFKLVSTAWSTDVLYNILLVIQTLCLPPFSWFSSPLSPQLVVGNLVSSISDTGFLIYSTAASPSTPAPTTYAARAWAPPASWTRAPSSAVSYSRGYISGATIVWCTPRSVSDFNNTYMFSANVPISIPSAGTVCIVDSDGTGDRGVVYYSDGVVWRKNSLTNTDLGLVTPTGARPSPEANTIWAPNPSSVTYAVESQNPPPASGRSAGYGTFSTWSNTTIFTNQIMITVNQIAGGASAVAVLIEMLRRIKPTGKPFTLFVGSTQYNIADARQI